MFDTNVQRRTAQAHDAWFDVVATAQGAREARFNHMPLGILAPREWLDTGDLIICPSSEVMLTYSSHLDEPRTVLTGTHKSRNFCTLRFAHGCQKVACHVRARGSSAPARIGFLTLSSAARRLRKGPGPGVFDSRYDEEAQVIVLGERSAARRPGAGAGACAVDEMEDESALRTTVEFRAPPPDILVGMVWRGGVLEIEGLTLTP